MNKWELFELAKEVLTDVELINNDEFHSETISISTQSGFCSVSGGPILSVHLTDKGFKMFMEHVRTRSEQIGEEVREPIETPHGSTNPMIRVSWLGVPGVEFFRLKEVTE